MSFAVKSRKRLSLILLAVTALFIGLLALYNYFILPKIILPKVMASFAPPPASVASEPARMEVMSTPFQAVGTVEAVNGTNISAEVGGTVQEIRFQSGQFVRKSDVLVVLNRASESADIALAQSTLNNAEQEVARADKLIKQGWITKSNYDIRIAARDQARAQVNRAQSETGKRVVRAPFSGRLGIRSVNLGDFVTAGQSLVSLSTVDPMYVTASLPEQAMRDVKVGQQVNVSIDSRPGAVFTGRITSLDSSVDPSTRTLRVQATLENKQSLLTPGMYAKLNVQVPNQRSAITIPETAITYSLSGNSVFILTRDKPGDGLFIAKQRIVTTGDVSNGRVEVLTGIKANDLVVTAGQLKIYDGAPAQLNQAMQLSEPNQVTR
jgi:membrane fusion protein, multidrug efflux system